MVQKSITIYLEGRKIGEWMLQDWINWINQWAPVFSWAQGCSKIVLLSQRIPIFCLKSASKNLAWNQNWNHVSTTEKPPKPIEDRNKVLRSQTSRSSCRHGRRILCLLLASCCCCWGMGYSGYSFGDGKTIPPKLWIYLYAGEVVI